MDAFNIGEVSNTEKESSGAKKANLENSPCMKCGSPFAWLSVYDKDQAKCLECDPPPGNGLVRSRLRLVSDELGPRWEEYPPKGDRALDGRTEAQGESPLDANEVEYVDLEEWWDSLEEATEAIFNFDRQFYLDNWHPDAIRRKRKVGK